MSERRRFSEKLSEMRIRTWNVSTLNEVDKLEQGENYFLKSKIFHLSERSRQTLPTS